MANDDGTDPVGGEPVASAPEAERAERAERRASRCAAPDPRLGVPAPGGGSEAGRAARMDESSIGSSSTWTRSREVFEGWDMTKEGTTAKNERKEREARKRRPFKKFPGTNDECSRG